MRIRIYVPSSGYSDSPYFTVDGGKVDLKDVTEEEAVAVFRLVESAFAKRFGTSTSVDPMARIATCFEAMVARESARHEERSYDKERIEELEKELKMVKVRAALTEEVKGWMRGVHRESVAHLNMREANDLRDHLPYEIGKLSFKEVLDLFIEEVDAAKHEMASDAIKPGKVERPVHANLDFQPGDRVQARDDTAVGTFAGMFSPGTGRIDYGMVARDVPLDDILHV